MLKYLIPFLLFANIAFSEGPPHFGPVGIRANEKITEEVRAYLNFTDPESVELESLLNMGKKASLWVNTINSSRPKDKWLDLSSPNKSGGISYQNPLKNNTTLLKARMQDYFNQTDPKISKILNSTLENSFPNQSPIDDDDFILSMRKLDRIYQASIRWAAARPWLSWYINKALYDVRGFLFLKNYPDLETALKNFNGLSLDEQKKLTTSLLDLCKNGDFDASDCKLELAPYIKRNNLFGFYERFNKYGQSMYDLFFSIKKTRSEILWNSDKSVLTSPFMMPINSDVKDWLKENVEDEWSKFEKKIFIDFKESTPGLDIPRIQFKEGVTANVNGIAGNLITMEAEYPISSPDQKWTIRHEYGHVLGFEDCYLEFFDVNEQAMIYYEVDVDNLMCSRNGKLQKTHIEQLLKKYQTY